MSYERSCGLLQTDDSLCGKGSVRVGGWAMTPRPALGLTDEDSCFRGSTRMLHAVCLFFCGTERVRVTGGPRLP